MRDQIEVVFENGLLRPLTALPRQYEEHQLLTVTIEGPTGTDGWLAEADPSASLDAVRQALASRHELWPKWFVRNATTVDPKGPGMADHFFDTSAAAKHYRLEIGTTEVDGLLACTRCKSNHFRARRRRIAIGPGASGSHGSHFGSRFSNGRGRFLADIAIGMWQVTTVAPAHFRHAQSLLVRHGLKHNLRTLDAVQLAVALDLNSLAPLAAFVCADADLCRIAAVEGLVVVNPDLP